MSELNRRQHNVNILMYHIVCPAKYRRAVISTNVDNVIREICIEIEKRFELKFLEIGMEENHVHFLVQAIPTYCPSENVQKIKSIIAREVFVRCPEVKKQLWGGEFWTKGYYIGTVGEHGDEKVITEYVKNQGRPIEAYKEIYNDPQLALFE
jgi:REP element-mobilizing transposase RayT